MGFVSTPGGRMPHGRDPKHVMPKPKPAPYEPPTPEPGTPEWDAKVQAEAAQFIHDLLSR